MRTRMTATLAICLAGGLAGGIALARPADRSAAHHDAGQVADSTPARAARPGTSLPIEISDFTFTSVVVPAGSVVEVRNNDAADHTVTADGGAFDTGLIPAGGATTFVAPTEPGVYPFTCALHPSMTGSLIVE